ASLPLGMEMTNPSTYLLMVLVPVRMRCGKAGPWMACSFETRGEAPSKLRHGPSVLGASGLQEASASRLLSPRPFSGWLAASVWPSVQRQCASSPTQKTCADQIQNLLRRQLWHHGLLERSGLSWLGLGEEFRRANHGHVKVMVSAILKQCLLESG